MTDKPIMTISWRMIEILCQRLAISLKECEPPGDKYTRILAVAKGGLIPAAIIGQHFPQLPVTSLHVSSYKGQQKLSVHRVLGGIPALDQGEHFLVIDDISDTGNTLTFINQMYPRSTAAVLVAKHSGAYAADIFTEVVSDNIWVKFPWEGDNI